MRTIDHVNHGGYAFPMVREVENGGDLSIVHGDCGMTMREWYAGMAMQGLIAGRKGMFDPHPQTLAQAAFALADAMIAQQSAQPDEAAAGLEV